MQTKTIHCLSVRQPFASWIIHGSKWCENRTWKTSHRGSLYIHASSWQTGYTAEQRELFQFSVPDGQSPVPTGAIIGCVDLLGCWPVDDIDNACGGLHDDDELEAAMQRLSNEPLNFFGWQTVEGPICWLMADRTPLILPIEAKGKLNVWTAEMPVEQLRLVEPSTR